MSLLFFVLLLFIFDFSFFIHMEIIKKKNLVLYSLSFTNLTSEERTLEFYDINDTPFVKEFDNFSGELFMYLNPMTSINTQENSIVLWCIYCIMVFCQSPS